MIQLPVCMKCKKMIPVFFHRSSLSNCFFLILFLGSVLAFSGRTDAFDVVKNGDRNETVVRMQELLNDLGFSPGKADGIFGKKTEQAVKDFQKDQRLKMTGIIDEETYSAMLELKETKLREQMPEVLTIDKADLDKWKPAGEYLMYPFSLAGRAAGFMLTVPDDQEEEVRKTVQFIFLEEDKSHTLKNAGMFYRLSHGVLQYIGLETADSEVFESDEFKEACVRLLRASSSQFDDQTRHTTLELADSDAKSIIDFCLISGTDSLLDQLKLSIKKDSEEKQYEFCIYF